MPQMRRMKPASNISSPSSPCESTSYAISISASASPSPPSPCSSLSAPSPPDSRSAVKRTRSWHKCCEHATGSVPVRRAKQQRCAGPGSGHGERKGRPSGLGVECSGAKAAPETSSARYATDHRHHRAGRPGSRA
eukprot:7272355-Prymnesium_polylepis.1